MTKTTDSTTPKQPPNATAAIVLSDGTIIWGYGFGAETTQVGEICFNTSITGYQEIMTDPSYAGEIITFTFPHIGNVGVNAEDIETINPCGAWHDRARTNHLPVQLALYTELWMHGYERVNNTLPGNLAGIDTRALTRRIRDLGAPNGVICVNFKGAFDIPALQAQAAEWCGLDGLDLAKDVTCTQRYEWTETLWTLGKGYGQQTAPQYHVVAMDFGAKRNILRCLAAAGCKVTVVPAQTSADDILALKPDGGFSFEWPGRSGSNWRLCCANDQGFA